MPSGNIEPSMPREMFCALPVITCKAFVSDGVPLPNAYYCPVYKTTKRGPTFVFRANLKTKAPAAKWILAGVGAVMDLG